MRSESAQASIEYVGVLLLVAALVGAIVGAFGAPTLTTRIAVSVVRAVADAIGQSDDPGAVRPSAAEQGMFDRAVDGKLPPDDRPSLRDVRLLLIAEHGDELGRELYSELVLDDLRNAVPGLAGPKTFATAGPSRLPSRVPQSLEPLDAKRSLASPPKDDPGEIETPIGRPDVHVVTVSEADEAFRRALNPGVSKVGMATDVVGAIPFGGIAVHLGQLAVTLEKAADVTGAIAGLYSVERDGEAWIASEASIPAGSREGDEVVSWNATRRPAGGGAVRRYERTAVVRDGVVIEQGIQPLEPGSYR
jgi:hypothetical protein